MPGLAFNPMVNIQSTGVGGTAMVSTTKNKCNNIQYLSFYLLNPTKLNAVQLLHSDLVSRNVDIALIRETWFGVRHADDSVSMEGFSLLHRDRLKRGCGGVCIYFRSCLDVTECIFPSTL